MKLFGDAVYKEGIQLGTVLAIRHPGVYFRAKNALRETSASRFTRNIRETRPRRTLKPMEEFSKSQRGEEEGIWNFA